MSCDSENFKKKKRDLSIKDRCDIIQRLNAGESATSLALEFKVSRQAISMIKKRQDTILKTRDTLKNCDGNIGKKRYKGQEENLLDLKLIKWFIQRRSMGLPIPGTMLKKQALIYNKRLNGKENFTASDGWLEKFKNRYGLKNKNIHGEKLSADLEASDDFKEKINNLIKVTGISLDCIYNCDETGLYWKIMPNKTLVGRHEKQAEGHKKPKNRVTVMACTNASGSHKIPLLMIGKSAQPRCFKGVKHLPVHYTHQENAWMTCDIMRSWYSDIFLPEIKKYHDLDKNPSTKIILIMDNAACHPSADELNKLCESCTVIFLPPNVTSLIQPLDQGIIEKFKRCYRNDLMEKILLEDEFKQAEKTDFLKTFNMLDACTLCRLAWNQVTCSDIRNCWKNLIPLTTNDNLNTSTISLIENPSFYALIKRIEQFKMITSEEVDHWLRIDDHDNGWQPLSDEDILADRSPNGQILIEELNDEVLPADQNCSNQDSVAEGNCPTFIEALSGLNTFLKWYQRKGEDVNILEYFQKVNHELIRQTINNN